MVLQGIWSWTGFNLHLNFWEVNLQSQKLEKRWRCLSEKLWSTGDRRMRPRNLFSLLSCRGLILRLTVRTSVLQGIILWGYHRTSRCLGTAWRLMSSCGSSQTEGWTHQTPPEHLQSSRTYRSHLQDVCGVTGKLEDVESVDGRNCCRSSSGRFTAISPVFIFIFFLVFHRL